MQRRLRDLRRYVDHRGGLRQALLDGIEQDEKTVEDFEAKAALAEKAVEVVHAATETRREELRDRVESLVTRGLRAVFDRPDFEFAFKVSLRGGGFGILPVLRSQFGDHDLETGIVDGHGGGVADVISFLLRVIVLSLTRPRVAAVLILDESFRHVSPEYLRGVAALLRELSASAGIQFLLVTHKDELLDAADVVYRARLVKGRTEFTLEHATRDESYHAAPKRGQVAVATSTAFDDTDLLEVGNAESKLSETQDFQARRQRSNTPAARALRSRKRKP